MAWTHSILFLFSEVFLFASQRVHLNFHCVVRNEVSEKVKWLHFDVQGWQSLMRVAVSYAQLPTQPWASQLSYFINIRSYQNINLVVFLFDMGWKVCKKFYRHTTLTYCHIHNYFIDWQKQKNPKTFIFIYPYCIFLVNLSYSFYGWS